MAHKIFGKRFISRAVPAWHNLGLVFDPSEEISPTEAARRVSGDIKVEACPLTYTSPAGTVLELPDHRAIIRMPTQEDGKEHLLGLTSKHWKPESYVDLTKPLDKIDQNHYKVETAGVLEKGGRFFMSLRGEDWSVIGDEMRTYFVVTLSLIPGVGHQILHTPVRVVCWNTQVMAEAQSGIRLRIGHDQDAAQEIGLCSTLLVRFREAQEKTKEIFETFAGTPAPRDTVDRIFSAAWPTPPIPQKLRLIRNATGSSEASEVFKGALDQDALNSITNLQETWERKQATVEKIRAAGWERFETFEPKGMSGTVWAAYNAVTEVADWRGDGMKDQKATLFGSRAREKEKAFSEAMKIIQN